jgi:hypothetical protein
MVRARMEAIVASYKVLYYNFPERTEEIHDKSQKVFMASGSRKKPETCGKIRRSKYSVPALSLYTLLKWAIPKNKTDNVRAYFVTSFSLLSKHINK